MSEIKKEIKVVQYYLKSKRLIKFDGDDESIPLKEDVAVEGTFAKGEKLEVSIEKLDDETLVVVNIIKVAGAKKESVPELKEGDVEDVPDEEPQSDSSAVVEKKKINIHAVSGNKEVMKISKDTPWVKISEALQQTDLVANGFKAKANVEITLTDGVITAYTVLDEEVAEKESNTSTSSSKSSSNSYGRNEDGMDKRTAIMCAKDTIVAMINVKSLANDKIEQAIDDLANKYYKVIQSL